MRYREGDNLGEKFTFKCCDKDYIQALASVHPYFKIFRVEPNIPELHNINLNELPFVIEHVTNDLNSTITIYTTIEPSFESNIYPFFIPEVDKELQQDLASFYNLKKRLILNKDNQIIEPYLGLAIHLFDYISAINDDKICPIQYFSPLNLDKKFDWNNTLASHQAWRALRLYSHINPLKAVNLKTINSIMCITSKNKIFIINFQRCYLKPFIGWDFSIDEGFLGKDVPKELNEAYAFWRKNRYQSPLITTYPVMHKFRAAKLLDFSNTDNQSNFEEMLKISSAYFPSGDLFPMPSEPSFPNLQPINDKENLSTIFSECTLS